MQGGSGISAESVTASVIAAASNNKSLLVIVEISFGENF
jgi:hypothetical protein